MDNQGLSRVGDITLILIGHQKIACDGPPGSKEPAGTNKKTAREETPDIQNESVEQTTRLLGPKKNRTLGEWRVRSREVGGLLEFRQKRKKEWPYRSNPPVLEREQGENLSTTRHICCLIDGGTPETQALY